MGIDGVGGYTLLRIRQSVDVSMSQQTKKRWTVDQDSMSELLHDINHRDRNMSGNRDHS
ncbi:hypothetical protein SAMN04489844_3749 [Nocardioides exalbidus]|uniref:Uncharacterized protein n=1 Tax=Nocardioides exalbidus TaxID=402596 RepID=A0A1H4Y9H3_9ACTN|nr:hypothetical protein SAMN04489844_3749 [Nocardioides exalbidus]